MAEHDLSRIAMACFLEGIDPATLALSPGHLVSVQSQIVELCNGSETEGYYRCIEFLSSSGGEEQR
ncbi:hypothetical protein EB061_08240 [bacterium]|nr:hypothetical protein [bacterium]